MGEVELMADYALKLQQKEIEFRMRVQEEKDAMMEEMDMLRKESMIQRCNDNVIGFDDEKEMCPTEESDEENPLIQSGDGKKKKKKQEERCLGFPFCCFS